MDIHQSGCADTHAEKPRAAAGLRHRLAMRAAISAKAGRCLGIIAQAVSLCQRHGNIRRAQQILFRRLSVVHVEHGRIQNLRPKIAERHAHPAHAHMDAQAVCALRHQRERQGRTSGAAGQSLDVGPDLLYIPALHQIRDQIRDRGRR